MPESVTFDILARDRASKVFKDVGRSSQGLGSKLAGLAKVAAKSTAIVVAAGLGTALAKGWGRLTQIEDAEGKLRGLGHSAETIKTVMDSALAAVKGTAFGLGDAATLAATAIAAGIKPGKELEKYLRLTADAATIAGGSLDELGSVINNVTTVGAAYNDSLQILAQKGLPVYAWLSEALGVSTAEVKELASKGKISSEVFREAIEKNIGGAALESGKTTKGALANLGAAVSRFGAGLLSGVFPKIKGAFAGLTDLLDQLAPTAQRWAESFSRVVAEGLTAFSDWWAEHGPAIIARAKGIAKAIGAWIKDVVPAIRSWVRDVLGELADWWRTWGPRITTIVEGLAETIAAFSEGVVDAVQLVHRNWDRLRVPVQAIAALIVAVAIPHYVALGVAAVASSVKQVGAWVASTAAGVAAVAAHSASVVAMVAKWVFLGAQSLAHAAKVVAGWAMTAAAAIAKTAVMVAQSVVFVARWALMSSQALLHAARIAAAWLIAMGPIALVILAVVGLVVVIIKNWDTIKNATRTAWEYVENKIRGVVDFITGVPGNISTAVSGMWDSLKDGLKAVVNWVLEQLDKILGPLDEIAGRIASIAGNLGNTASKGLGRFLGPLGGATGGLVPSGLRSIYRAGGGPAGTDTIPAWLSPGEFVMRRSAVDRLGVGMMEAINAGNMPFGGRHVQNIELIQVVTQDSPRRWFDEGLWRVAG